MRLHHTLHDDHDEKELYSIPVIDSRGRPIGLLSTRDFSKRFWRRRRISVIQVIWRNRQVLAL